jgi:uncharacterized cupin superfamily protein
MNEKAPKPIPKPIVNIDELPLTAEARGIRFAAETCEFGVMLGLYRVGATLHVVPPGKRASPFHRHHTADEMFLILSGVAEYRLGDEHLPVKAGDCLGAPAGGQAHQIINTGSEPLRYLAFSNNTNADVVEYPDSGRIRIDIGATGTHREDATFKAGGRLVPMDYWEGEDVGDEEP